MDFNELIERFMEEERGVAAELKAQPFNFSRVANRLSLLFSMTDALYLRASERVGGDDDGLRQAIAAVKRFCRVLTDLRYTQALREADKGGTVTNALKEFTLFLDKRRKSMEGMLKDRQGWQKTVTDAVGSVLPASEDD